MIPIYDISLLLDVEDAQYPDALKRAIDNVLTQSDRTSRFGSAITDPDANVISAFQSFAK